jgi:hypothetical protein
MAFTRLIGIGFATAGSVFLIAGMGVADTPFDELARQLATTQTPQAMWFLATGAAAIVAGAALAFVSPGY